MVKQNAGSVKFLTNHVGKQFESADNETFRYILSQKNLIILHPWQRGNMESIIYMKP
jgi:hypothetical protein